MMKTFLCYFFPSQEIKQEEEEKLVLDSNPLEWTVTDVVRFIKLTDCAPLAKIFQEQVEVLLSLVPLCLFMLQDIPPCWLGLGLWYRG